MKAIILLITLVSLLISIPAYAEVEYNQFEVESFTTPVKASPSQEGCVSVQKADGSRESVKIFLTSGSTKDSVARDVVGGLSLLGIKAEIVSGATFKVEQGKLWWASHASCTRK